MARWKTSRVSRIERRRFEVEERVAPEAEPQRLEADDVAEGHVAEIDVGPEKGDEGGLQLLGRGFEEEPVGVGTAGQDGLHKPVAELAVGPAEPAAAALPGFGDHQVGT